MYVGVQFEHTIMTLHFFLLQTNPKPDLVLNNFSSSSSINIFWQSIIIGAREYFSDPTVTLFLIYAY